jgi:hypothetical protein
VANAGALMHAVACRDKSLFVLVHEPGPALNHVYDVKFCFVDVPTSALLGSTVGFNELNQKSTSGGLGYAKIAVQKKVP